MNSSFFSNEKKKVLILQKGTLIERGQITEKAGVK
jgi:hypothetical protein